MASRQSSQERVAQLERENAAQRERIGALQSQLDWFKRQLFGPKSEKRLDVLPEQGDFGELFATRVDGGAPELGEQVGGYRRRRRKGALEGQVSDTGLRFDERVPVEVIELEVPELRGPDAAHYEIITTRETYRLAKRPGSYVVLKYVQPVVKHKGEGHMHSAAPAASVLEKSFADVSFLAGMLCDKFLYHLPLYRQHQMLADAGVMVARSTLTQLAHRTIALVEPIYDAQWRGVLLSQVLAMDETPIKAGREKRGKMHQGYFWPVYGEAHEVCFAYTTSRGGRHVQQLLGEFAGTLLSDGYHAYARYAELREAVLHALCWSHTRRAFVKAEKLEPEAVVSALDFIGALYHYEDEIRKQGLNDAQTLAYRQAHSRPAVDAFFEWCAEQVQRMDLVPSNPLSKALAYARERETGLRVFLDDARVPIDTNHLERALRAIPMGRRNWLFCWTEIGAHYVGVIQSLLVTCRLHDINPYTYLVDVLQRVGEHPATKVEQLTPRLWKQYFSSDPLLSPLDSLNRLSTTA